MNESLDIAFIVSVDTMTGTYFRYHNLAVALAERGHRLTVYSQHRHKRLRFTEETRGGVRYLIAPSVPGDRYVGFTINPGNVLGRFLRGSPGIVRHDLYHLFQPHCNAACVWLAVRAWRRNRVRPSVFVWDWDDLWAGGLFSDQEQASLPDRIYRRSVDFLEHCLPASADLVTTCSYFLADLARRRGAREVSVVHNGFWPQPIYAAGNSKADRRRTLGLDPDAFYLAFTGWTLGEIDWCLDVVQALLPRHPVRLACCGYDVRPHLAQAPPAVRDRVDYLGVLSADETRQVLEVLEVGLLPMPLTQFNKSRMPMKFAEYLAADLVVMCGATGEVGLLGKTLKGVHLLPSDRQGWVAGCVEAVSNLIQGTSTTASNRHSAGDLLAWPTLTKKLEASYRQALFKAARLLV